ncbi:MAG: hypothetical protein KDK70_42785, partial [Myxococcales bacterium]|nr:hypothetical protein [Myxococcales bacterium]
MRYRLTFRRRKRLSTADRLRKAKTGSFSRRKTAEHERLAEDAPPSRSPPAPSSSARPGIAPAELSALLDALPGLAPRIRIDGLLPSGPGRWILEATEHRTHRPLILKLRTLDGERGWADWDRFSGSPGRLPARGPHRTERAELPHSALR